MRPICVQRNLGLSANPRYFLADTPEVRAIDRDKFVAGRLCVCVRWEGGGEGGRACEREKARENVIGCVSVSRSLSRTHTRLPLKQPHEALHLDTHTLSLSLSLLLSLSHASCRRLPHRRVRERERECVCV